MSIAICIGQSKILYENDYAFRLFCAQIDALAFLPPDKVTDDITYLRDSAPEEASELLNYFDSTYVSRPASFPPLSRPTQPKCPHNTTTVSSTSLEHA